MAIKFSREYKHFNRLGSNYLTQDTYGAGEGHENCELVLDPVVEVVSDLELVLSYEIFMGGFAAGNAIRIIFSYTNNAAEGIDNLAGQITVTTPPPGTLVDTGLNFGTLAAGASDGSTEAIYTPNASDIIRGYVEVEASGTGDLNPSATTITSNTATLRIP